MIDRFNELLNELSSILNFTLKRDDNISTLLVDKKLFVQLKFHEENDFLLIISPVTTLLPGKFREDVFKKALISHQIIPHTASFGYSPKNSELILFNYVKSQELDGNKLKNYLSKFISLALFWKEAIEKSDISALTYFINSPQLALPKLNE